MTAGLVLGVAWSLVTGLAGAWLMVSPWALGQQPGGRDWTSVTTAQFGTGLGLIVLAVLGLVLVAANLIRSLRDVGVLETRPGRPATPSAPGEPTQPEMEQVLLALANAMTADLKRQAQNVREPGERSVDQPPARADEPWRRSGS